LYVFVFIVRSESKRLLETDCAAEDMNESIRAIFVYIAADIDRIVDKGLNIRNF